MSRTRGVFLPSLFRAAYTRLDDIGLAHRWHFCHTSTPIPVPWGAISPPVLYYFTPQSHITGMFQNNFDFFFSIFFIAPISRYDCLALCKNVSQCNGCCCCCCIGPPWDSTFNVVPPGLFLDVQGAFFLSWCLCNMGGGNMVCHTSRFLKHLYVFLIYFLHTLIFFSN